jgi:hypothetical protein
MQPFSAADIDYVRVRNRNSDSTDRSCGLLIEEGRPGAAIVIRLPDAAVDYSYIEYIRMSRNSGGSLSATTSIRADSAPVERLKKRRVRLLS